MEQNEIFRKTNLERISSPEKLNDYIKVINPSVIVILMALGVLLIGGLTWGFFGNIPLTEQLTGNFYSNNADEVCDKMVSVVPADVAANLREGAEVQISPKTADRDTYGYIVGIVESISQYPASKENIMAVLGNEQLADELLQGGGGLLVTVTAKEDNATVSGLKWSVDKGGEVPVNEGAASTGLVIVRNQKPIELILGE